MKGGEKLHGIGVFSSRNCHLVEGGGQKYAENVPFSGYLPNIYRGPLISYMYISLCIRGRGATSSVTYRSLATPLGAYNHN